MHWSCIAHSHLLHTPSLPLSCIGLYLVHPTCHVYFILCSTLFCLKIELHFLIHLTPLMHHYHCSFLHLLPSFLLDHLSCFFILACHVYLMLCNTLFCLKIELHFLIHLAPLMHHYHCSFLHLLPSFLLDHLSS